MSKQKEKKVEKLRGRSQGIEKPKKGWLKIKKCGRCLRRQERAGKGRRGAGSESGVMVGHKEKKSGLSGLGTLIDKGTRLSVFFVPICQWRREGRREGRGDRMEGEV